MRHWMTAALCVGVAAGMAVMEGCARKTVVRHRGGEDVVVATGPTATEMAQRDRSTVVVEPKRDIVVTPPQREVVVTDRPMVVVERPIDPPPLRVETRTAAPSSDVVWVPGGWEWVDGNWEWVPGHWVRPASATAVWEPGRWVAVPGGYAWQPGRWR